MDFGNNDCEASSDDAVTYLGPKELEIYIKLIKLKSFSIM